MDVGIKAMLDGIAYAEGHGKPLDYNATYAYGKYTDEPVVLTEMTLDEVRALQELMIRRQRGSRLISSAVGRYQFIRKTFNDCQRSFRYPGNTLFSTQVQDNFGAYLLHKRGFDKWRDKRMSRSNFQNNLAKEWASIPTTRGVSHYGQGVGINQRQLYDVFERAKDRTPVGITPIGTDDSTDSKPQGSSFLDWLFSLFERIFRQW